ncbi:MAG TPA: hypothetical protein VK947_10500 [Planococcus sp. (in: firmicutes)]|nr:hypothetical protein [Planococcus sp. (in: firmicutes)]
MVKNQSAELKGALNWDLRGYDEYIAGYKLYKRLKKKWDAIEIEEASEAIQ